MQDNRKIKQVLVAIYGRGNVTVSSRRGSSWSRVHINRVPLDQDQANEWRAEVRQHLVNADCDLGRAYTDDDCRYEMDRTHIDFEMARFWRTFKAEDGTIWGQQRPWGPEASEEWIKAE